MYSFFKMVYDFIMNGNLHWFIIFYVFIFVRSGIVLAHALRYKNYKIEDEKVHFNTSVIIPVVDEPLDLFKEVVTKIAEQNPKELIIVVNGPENKPLIDLCNQIKDSYADSIHKDVEFKILYTPIAGKRNAVKIGVENSSPDSEICVLVDSDTIWTDRTLIELLKPFACDEKIGGVTTKQRIYKPNRNFITMTANILEEIRSEGTMRAMSQKNSVGCLPGRTIAFRTSILRESMDEFMTEVFMDIHKEESDDRSLTNITLKKGYKTVLQDSSVVYTDAPTGFKKFVRQQFRWAEGSQYNNLRMMKWNAKHAPLTGFCYFSDMLMPFLVIATYVNIILSFIFSKCGIDVGTVLNTETWWFLLIAVFIGSIISFGSRNFRILKYMPWYYILLIPFFIIFLTFVMTPIRVIGLYKCADTHGWGTRNLGENCKQKRKHTKYQVLVRILTTLVLVFFSSIGFILELFL